MGGIALYSLCAADGVRHYSPHVWKAILALRHKGLEFDLRPVSFADIPRIAGGGFDSVPVLDDRGHRLGDSFGIALHLEAAHSGPSLFPGAGQQALARLVEHHCDTVLNPPLSVIVVRRMHDMMDPPDQRISGPLASDGSAPASRNWPPARPARRRIFPRSWP